MYRMVVADDEYIVVEGIKAILERLKLECQVVGFAYDGITALEVIRETMPDLVITDIRMPGLDGLSLIESCKEFLPEASYVVISGYTEFEYARRALTLGVVDYIDKPITVQKLQELIGGLDRRNGLESRVLDRIGQETDLLVDRIIRGQARGLEEETRKLLSLLRDKTSGMERYRQEVYKLLALLMEVYKETNTEDICRLSLQDAESWRTAEEADAYCLRIVRRMQEIIQGKKVGSGHRTIQKLLLYIDEKYADNIGLNELAALVDMNPAYLSLLFREEVGVSYVKYLTDLRIRKAREFLDSGMKVTEVSERVGYYSYRYFCEIFKKHEGQTPNEYKGHVRRKNDGVS